MTLTERGLPDFNVEMKGFHLCLEEGNEAEVEEHGLRGSGCQSSGTCGSLESKVFISPMGN